MFRTDPTCAINGASNPWKVHGCDVGSGHQGVNETHGRTDRTTPVKHSDPPRQRGVAGLDSSTPGTPSASVLSLLFLCLSRSILYAHFRSRGYSRMRLNALQDAIYSHLSMECSSCASKMDVEFMPPWSLVHIRENGSRSATLLADPFFRGAFYAIEFRGLMPRTRAADGLSSL